MKKFLLLIFLLTPLLSHSQILNIERLRLEKDTAKSFLFKATFGLNAYNRSAAADEPVSLFGYNLDLNAIYYPQKHAYIFVSNFDYLKINEEDFLNFGFAHGRINFLRDNKTNYETFIQFSYDNFRGLDPRWIFGGAVRHHIVKSEKVTLLFGIGGMYEFEKWQHPHSEGFVEANFFKSSNYISLRAALNEYVDVNLVNYYQVGFDPAIQGFRNRVSGSLILNAKLTERLSLTNSFDLGYEDKPIVPITQLIYAFKSGLSLDF